MRYIEITKLLDTIHLYINEDLLEKYGKSGSEANIVKFIYNEQAYASKAYSNRPIAELNMQGTLRGIQVASLTINPVSYNPSENTIQVYNDIEVEVSYGQYDKSVAQSEFDRTANIYFKGIYNAMFNWRDDVYSQHPDIWNGEQPVKFNLSRASSKASTNPMPQPSLSSLVTSTKCRPVLRVVKPNASPTFIMKASMETIFRICSTAVCLAA